MQEWEALLCAWLSEKYVGERSKERPMVWRRQRKVWEGIQMRKNKKRKGGTRWGSLCMQQKTREKINGKRIPCEGAYTWHRGRWKKWRLPSARMWEKETLFCMCVNEREIGVIELFFIVWERKRERSICGSGRWRGEEKECVKRERWEKWEVNKENKLSSINTRMQKREKEERKKKKRKRKRRRDGGEDSTRACKHTRAQERIRRGMSEREGWRNQTSSILFPLCARARDQGREGARRERSRERERERGEDRIIFFHPLPLTCVHMGAREWGRERHEERGGWKNFLRSSHLYV